MSSLILSVMTRFLMPLLLLFSIFLLLRGHNAPGGGFTGGLVAAAAFAQYAIANDAAAARRLLRVDPRVLIGVGLLVATGSAVVSLLLGLPLMTGQWVVLHSKQLGDIHLGTPLVFDTGVYLVVFGVTLSMIVNLAEE